MISFDSAVEFVFVWWKRVSCGVCEYGGILYAYLITCFFIVVLATVLHCSCGLPLVYVFVCAFKVVAAE